MKILYVSDNRVRGNFGCRATSTALSQMLRVNNDIVGVISGRYTNMDTNELIFWDKFPSWIYPMLGKLTKKSIVRKLFYKLIILKLSRMSSDHYLAGSCDFISLNFERSIENLKKCLPANSYLKEFNLDDYDFDTMVVNGEGSFIFSTPEWHWREALVLSMLMYWAQKKGKKVYFMNAMLSEETTTSRNDLMIHAIGKIFEKCDIFTVRENASLDFAKAHFPRVNVKLIPDALFTWYPLVNDGQDIHNYQICIPHNEECDEMYLYPSFDSPYICVAGSSSARISKNIEHTISVYTNLVNTLKTQYEGNVFLVEVCEGDCFLRAVSKLTKCPIIPIETPILSAAKILSKAEAFVSGRYHPAIMASLGGTPCVFMGSNSHKTRSLQELLNYNVVKEFNEVPSDEEIFEIVTCMINLIQQGERLREEIKQRAYCLCEKAKEVEQLLKNN